VLRVVFDSRYALHETGAGHPERPARLEALRQGFQDGGCTSDSFFTATPASADVVASVHDRGYIDLVARFCAKLPDGRVADLPTGDTVVSRASYEIALLAAGGALAALDMSSLHHPAFAIVRPPGHHAGPARGMGFCVFNNIALAAQRARRDRGPALIVDFDYHHGNGTQDWMEGAVSDGAAPIGFISTHAYPAYPGTGAFSETRFSEGGFIVDIPLPHDTDTSDFIAVWAALLPPLAKKIRPKAILVSAGFDFLAGDPIAGLPVAAAAVNALSALLAETASEHGATLTMILEGGYALENLRAAGASLARSFAGPTYPCGPVGLPQDARLKRMVEQVLAMWVPM
jgi:acetoin utilization deacetylase AcuC-like enzyme